MQSTDSNNALMKGPKRKRLAKACDACHKSKRRCDGTGSYYASKQCSYTDASGRSVPAPRPFKPEAQSSSSSSDNRSYPSSNYLPSSSNQFRIYPNASPAQYQSDSPDDDHKHVRKRFRNERGNPMPVDDLVIDGPVSMDRPVPIELDPSLTRELTNLFFAHCHPARAVIHKPTFASSLSHNRVPSHLLLAVCALAAPLSKQPRIRTTPSRFAGKTFALEALSQMFDGAGRLVVEPDLATAQALCILQMHDILTNERNSVWSSRFHDLALQIVENLGVHSPEHPTLTPVPSQEFVQAAIEREAIRRIFWLIHLLDVLASIYFKKPTTFADVELRLRLPVDETSFELGVHSTLPEYLYLPAVRTQYASEFGHFIRILSIYAKMEFALDEGTDTESAANSAGALLDVEQKMEEWDRTLPEHLRFSEQSLQVQQSMFETSSNTGAWCWCCIHIYHASCALAVNLARQRAQRGSRTEPPPWALEKIDLILQMLGDRAKNSILMGSALWSLVKYCKRDDPQVRKWAAEYEEAYGTKIFEFVQDWRSQPSPPQQHMYPSHTQSQQKQTQAPGHPSGFNALHQFSHRRLSDVRNPSNQNYGLMSNSSSTRHQLAAESSSYSNPTSNVMKRSPSHSPPTSYSLGRPPNSNNNTIISGASGRDVRSSLTQNQGQSVIGKFSNRDSNSSHSHLRWPSAGGGTGDGGTQTSYSGALGGGVTVGSSDMNGSPLGRVLGVSNNTGIGSSTTLNGNAGNLNQRNTGLLAEGYQSLPSLKASGLLDSWPANSSSRTTGDAQKQNGNPPQQPQSLPSSQRTNLSNLNLMMQPQTHLPSLSSETADLRPTTLSSMPVGLQWLANESR
ncbi:fungal-specific transcription factor domain-containing protein [Gymnopilus junonius]|uniref:Fungal-specific transcription factor domain-containing protein n=1 Tax=Gymnopilus junonius TaxID=109634 RepID=A0A9P5NWV5_GYMJU|nr:fungal-specific transcription factor domain-containing protein [Gymnopilus junonius]